MKRVRATVRGRVQGVGFRAFAAREARRRGLGGWVRNELDGSVSVLAQGEDAAVDAFLAWLRQGPPSARVTSVDPEWLAADAAPDLVSFEIR
jgi:acylphosphatase